LGNACASCRCFVNTCVGLAAYSSAAIDCHYPRYRLALLPGELYLVYEEFFGVVNGFCGKKSFDDYCGVRGHKKRFNEVLWSRGEKSPGGLSWVRSEWAVGSG